jgi:hypothetical protein
MTRWHGNPQQIADTILLRVRSGEVKTSGQWTALASTTGLLPPRLRTWVWRQLEQEIGYDAVSYLRTWQCGSTMEVLA